MNEQDKALGMGCDISRRDFLNGTAAAVGAAMLPLDNAAGSASVYPPSATGLRGNHPGSYDAAHALTWQKRSDWGSVAKDDTEYDLLVVGAGISGLAAAYRYQEQQPQARILILDNHDDFGGHAKRNEFRINGQTIIGYGGSQALEDPNSYSRVCKKLLRNIGVDVKRFHGLYDHEFFSRHGLSGGTFFDKKNYGIDKLVNFSVVDYSLFLDVKNGTLGVDKAVSQMPISPGARQQLLKLLTTTKNHLVGIPASAQADYLWGISYRDFLEKHLDITEKELFDLFQGLTADMTSSIETCSAMGVMSYNGLPGIKATAIASYNDYAEPYIYHFPDGNASIARLLVRHMIPDCAPGNTMDDVVLARFDYSKLDRPDAPVRLRLNSTAVDLRHEGDPKSASKVSAIYIKDGGAYQIRAKHCVMAGYNAMLADMCPELPETQEAALRLSIKSPIVYTSVLLKNWRAWKNLNLGFFASPGAYYAVSMLDFPVSMGGYEFSKSPDHPIIVHMERFAKGDDPTLPPRQQRLAGRRELFATPFKTLERETRLQLAGALGEGGFDPAKDIAGITVNRWGHGYSYWHNNVTDPELSEDEMPHVVGRRGFGRIAIANADAGGNATIESAIEQAYRAVDEVLS